MLKRGYKMEHVINVKSAAQGGGHSMWKRWLLMVALLAGVGVIVWYALPAAPSEVKEGDTAPEFSLADLEGNQQTLPKGQVILLNFWATWCPPCRREMPSMVALHQRLERHGLKIIAVSVDRDRGELAGFVREYSIPFEVLHDADASVSHRYGVFRYPETFLIDRDGKVRYHLIGAVDWTNPQVLAVIQAMLIRKRKG